ncbi:MAG: guanylate kinase [Lachnospiraceae bacterium]|nr:guanylate kinase [Lachnospiraceae bacterium]
MGKGSLIVVSGFSGAGKGTVMKKLVSSYENYVLSVSMTTRTPREGEIDGREYFFVTRDIFEKTIRENGLLEHAEYVGNYYGTPHAYVEKMQEEGKDVLLEIDVQGGMQIRGKFPEAILLFLVTPSAAELEKRLSMRHTETPEQIRRRLLRAREEAVFIPSYDYVVINDDLEACAQEVDRIVRSAKCAPNRKRAFVEQMTKDLSLLVEES